MTIQTILCGLALMVIGIYGYMQGQDHVEADYKAKVEKWEADGKPDPAPVKKDVKTALIPAVFGGLLILCGVFVMMMPRSRKHIMHLAAMIGVLGFIGGFVPMMRADKIDFDKPAIRNGLYMVLVCGVFVVLCVKSFIDARKARTANPSTAV